MAVPTVNSVSTDSGNGVGQFTSSHTVAGSLTDPVLLAVYNSPSFSEPDSVTWQGINLAKLPTRSLNYWCSAWYLINPPSATSSVVANYSTFPYGLCITAFTLAGAKAISAVTTSSGTGTAPSVTLTNTEDDSLILDFIMSEDQTHTQGTGQTEQSNHTVINSITGFGYRQSTSTKSGSTAGDHTMSVTLGSSVTYQITSLSVDSIDTAFTSQANIM